MDTDVKLGPELSGLKHCTCMAYLNSQIESVDKFGRGDIMAMISMKRNSYHDEQSRNSHRSKCVPSRYLGPVADLLANGQDLGLTLSVNCHIVSYT